VITYLRKPERLSAGDRRKQLIEVAIDLFSRKGFGGTTTKEIAAAAGVNEAIIFRHFTTKQKLYEAILDYRIGTERFQCGVAELRRLMEAKDDEAVFGWLTRKIVEVYREDSKFERLMLFAALEGHEIAVMHMNVVTPFLNQLRKYVASRQAEGALAKCDPMLAVTAAIGMGKQFALRKYLFGWHQSETGDDAAAESLTRLLMDGLKPRGRRR
jgi:TetR/AcrR family transcriptional regulator